MNPDRLLAKLQRGDLNNVTFGDFTVLLRHFGFRLERSRGSHHIFRHGTRALRLNVQPRGGEVTPYQIRQLLVLVEREGLDYEQ